MVRVWWIDLKERFEVLQKILKAQLSKPVRDTYDWSQPDENRKKRDDMLEWCTSVLLLYLLLSSNVSLYRKHIAQFLLCIYMMSKIINCKGSIMCDSGRRTLRITSVWYWSFFKLVCLYHVQECTGGDLQIKLKDWVPSEGLRGSSGDKGRGWVADGARSERL